MICRSAPSRQRLTVSVASLTMAMMMAPAAVSAQDDDGAYAYAVPAPVEQMADPEVVFEPAPVVQPLPQPLPPRSPVAASRADDMYTADPALAGADMPPAIEAYDRPVRYAPPMPPQAPVAAQGYDRDAWLEQCYDHMNSARRGGDGGVIGGVIGAAAGGLLGNRIADGNRLAGTLIGAGVGGLAGAAVGSAADRTRSAREVRAYCADYLAQHEARYGGGVYGGNIGYTQPYAGQAYVGHAYYPGPVQYVQVLIPIEQRAVVREYVEYVTEPVTTYAPVKRQRIIERAPTRPVPLKKSRYIKGK